jgi:hypothetical protein
MTFGMTLVNYATAITGFLSEHDDGKT